MGVSQVESSVRGGNFINQEQHQGQTECRLWAEWSPFFFIIRWAHVMIKMTLPSSKVSPALTWHKWMSAFPLWAEAFGCYTYRDIFCSQLVRHSVHMCRAPTVSCTTLGASPSGVWEPRGKSGSTLPSAHRLRTDGPPPGRETAKTCHLWIWWKCAVWKV